MQDFAFDKLGEHRSQLSQQLWKYLPRATSTQIRSQSDEFVSQMFVAFF